LTRYEGGVKLNYMAMNAGLKAYLAKKGKGKAVAKKGAKAVAGKAAAKGGFAAKMAALKAAKGKKKK
jgi:hypothetical protein